MTMCVHILLTTPLTNAHVVSVTLSVTACERVAVTQRHRSRFWGLPDVELRDSCARASGRGGRAPSWSRGTAATVREARELPLGITVPRASPFAKSLATVEKKHARAGTLSGLTS